VSHKVIKSSYHTGDGDELHWTSIHILLCCFLSLLRIIEFYTLLGKVILSVTFFIIVFICRDIQGVYEILKRNSVGGSLH
jgi:hypothetical protein